MSLGRENTGTKTITKTKAKSTTQHNKTKQKISKNAISKTSMWVNEVGFFLVSK